MRLHNLYTDAGGQSHFRDIEVEWVEERRGSKLSKHLSAIGIIFRETQAEHDIDWHPAPRRQYIINLDAGVKITASDDRGTDEMGVGVCFGNGCNNAQGEVIDPADLPIADSRDWPPELEKT